MKHSKIFDFWLGIPLTALATLLLKIFSLLTLGRKKINQVQNVLFIELSEMGTTVLADPAIKKIKKNHNVFFVIYKKNAPSLFLMNSIPDENVFTINNQNIFSFLIDIFRFSIWARKVAIQATVNIEGFSRFSSLLSFMSGARQRVGFTIPNGEGLYRGGINTHSVAYNPYLHISKNFISLVEPLLGNPQNSFYVKRVIDLDETVFLPPTVPFSEIEKLKIKLSTLFPGYTSSCRVVLVNVNAGHFLPQRKWPVSSFISLIQLILESQKDICIVLTGTTAERPYVERVKSVIESDCCVNAAGIIAISEFPALFMSSKLIVTNDSGPAHFASGYGLKSLVLFGPETPQLYGPQYNSISITAGLACSPCVSIANNRTTSCNNNICMTRINPEFVYSLVASALTHVSCSKNNSRIEICP